MTLARTIPNALWLFSGGLLVSAVGNLSLRLQSGDLWMAVLLFELSLIAAILIVLVRSYTIAITYSAAVVLNLGLIVTSFIDADVTFEQLSPIMLGILFFDLISLSALWSPSVRAVIQPSKADAIAAICGAAVVMLMGLVTFALGLFLPFDLKLLAVIVFAIGAIAFGWIKQKRTHQF